MLSIRGRSLSAVGSFVALLLAVLVATACNSEMRLSYHVIEPDTNAISQVVAMCRTGEKRSFAYRFPDGDMVELTASATAAFSVNIGSSADIRLTKMPRNEEDGKEVVVEVAVIPPPRDMAEAEEHRARLEWCDLLVMVRGMPVGVVHGGAGRWEDRLPGGVFDSYESAEDVYSALAENLHRDVSTREVDERDAKRSKWLMLRDTWEFHCNEETKAAIKAKDPSAYKRFMARPIPDCQQPPIAPR
jgi:hypothetical protein